MAVGTGVGVGAGVGVAVGAGVAVGSGVAVGAAVGVGLEQASSAASVRKIAPYNSFDMEASPLRIEKRPEVEQGHLNLNCISGHRGQTRQSRADCRCFPAWAALPQAGEAARGAGIVGLG